jgi:hypothetical protein
MAVTDRFGGVAGRAAMSVIIATERFETIRKTIQHLHAQTMRDQLEIVIAAPTAEALAFNPEEVEGFFGVRVVEVGSITVLPWARATAIRHASAPIVAMAESHSFPSPGWAEALLDAHRGPWAVVGPVFTNANPASALSRSNLVADYGKWMSHAAAGELSDLPGRNIAYKRAVLQEYDTELEAMMEVETIFHWELRRKGHRFYLEPRATTAHVNVSLPWPWLVERFNAGRWFAGARSWRWPLVRRLLYAAGSPLIPLIRMRRTLLDIRQARQGYLLRILPALFVGLIVGAGGEMLGYVLGAGPAKRFVSQIELYKLDCVRPEERQAILSGTPTSSLAGAGWEQSG